MIKRFAFPMIACVLIVSVVSCTAATPSTAPAATVAAQTLEAMLTQLAIQVPQTPTPEPSSTIDLTAEPSYTSTIIPTVQFISSTPNLQNPTSKVPSPTINPTSLLTRTITNKCNAAFFVGDVGPIYDNSEIKAGDPFIKTWDVRNVGTCTWGTNYRLFYYSGFHLGGPNYINFPQSVPPNGHTFLSVNLVAPMDVDTYLGRWYLMDADGHRFGVGPKGNEPLTVKIKSVP